MTASGQRPQAAATARPALRRALLAWFRQSGRDLPWRRTKDPYQVWVSEIMLQQTRVEAVVPYYARFMRAFPNLRKLAAAPLDRVLKLWEGLGYYSRARNLHRAAQRLAAASGGPFPATAKQWEQLPGVGRYTAGAIASIACGQAVPVVDGNVTRVLTRLYRIETCIDEKRTRDELWRRATSLVSRKAPGDFNQALMELGARICVPRAPRCDQCPLARWCAARAAPVAEHLPVRRPRRKVPRMRAAAAVLHKNGRYLLVRRPESGLLAGLWAWPAWEVCDGQSPSAALRKHLHDTLGLRVRVGRPVATVEHVFSHRRLQLEVFVGAVQAGRLKPRAGKWISRAQLIRYPLATVDRKVLDCLDRLDSPP